MVTSVELHDRDGAVVAPVGRFLQHILDSDGSPNTASAYGFDLNRPATALNFGVTFHWGVISGAVSRARLGGPD